MKNLMKAPIKRTTEICPRKNPWVKVSDMLLQIYLGEGRQVPRIAMELLFALPLPHAIVNERTVHLSMLLPKMSMLGS